MRPDTDPRFALATSLTCDLVNDLLKAYPHRFSNRADIENCLGNRLRDLASMQRINGVECGDDFILTDEGDIITTVVWQTGFSRGPAEHLVMELAPTGAMRSFDWTSTSPQFHPTCLTFGVLPDFEVCGNIGHLASRRTRGNYQARTDFEPSIVLDAINNAVLSNKECLRTVFEGKVGWAVPITLYEVYAMVSFCPTTMKLQCSTLLNRYQVTRHVNSAYLGGDNFGAAY